MAKNIEDFSCGMEMAILKHAAALANNEESPALTLVERPVVDEDDFGEMCFRVYDSTQYDYAITVSWFRETDDGLGVVKTDWGVVRNIDVAQRKFKLVNDWEAQWIGVEDLVRVVKTKRAGF
ncbi:hypothetical protein [Brevibacillus borstelensis]|uniref:hypothetical protein n=1 Tax=Brevibacillus borstelensis TaxID=45462 RepID=UPI0030C5EBE2